MKKSFNREKITSQLTKKVSSFNTVNEKIRASVKYENSLVENGTISCNEDRLEYLSIACDVIGIRKNLYSSASYIEAHGTNFEKNGYTLENAVPLSKKIRDRVGEQLKLEHPELTRVCAVCGQEKHLSEYYNNGFYERLTREVKVCKECERARRKADYMKKNNDVTGKPIKVIRANNIMNDDFENSISRYAVLEITNNIKSKKKEIDELFVEWEEVLAEADDANKTSIINELEDMIYQLQRLKKGIHQS